ncbi:hypothetical protein [Yinghuangia seranimata]|uniref:hypothetical protein n=1 Tax=Yinghuangia seranimata TaxID=408067 RepID=UPI00248B047C|nr:hypothetical protein [Yinghuangia seranimata]MDI2128978.1 hypothetical protein [Yinghuangia seranimata]
MTAAPPSPPPPASVRDLLFGDDGETATEALVAAARENEVAAMLGRAARGLTDSAGETVEHEVASVVNGFLSMDLLDLAAAGWIKHRSLAEAAQRTRAAPGSEEVVAMATHKVTSTHRPCVDLTVDGARVGTLDLALTVAFEIRGMVAVVREARMTSLRCGSCTTTGTLAMQRIVVASRRCTVDLPGSLRLRSGIPLLPEPTTSSRNPPRR